MEKIHKGFIKGGNKQRVMRTQCIVYSFFSPGNFTVTDKELAWKLQKKLIRLEIGSSRAHFKS